MLFESGENYLKEKFRWEIVSLSKQNIYNVHVRNQDQLAH